MEQNITMFCDVDPMLDDLKVLARCISKWVSHPIGNPSDVWSLDFVFQDTQGNRIQATVKKDRITMFQLLIDEGSCYRISNFGVGENGGRFPLLNHRFKMNLFKNTSVIRLASFDSNTRGFKFEPFPNFITRRFKESELVDVIETIVSISDPITFNKFGVDKIRRTVLLEDVDGGKLECCFFDAWADKFTKLAEISDKVGHAVYADIDGYDPKKHTITVFSPAKKILTPEEFFERAVKKSVGSIRDTENIHKIHRKHGWAYLACKKCGSAAKEVLNKNGSSSSSKSKKQQVWNCKKCKEITAVGMKFKVIVCVIDDSGSASFLLFDDMVYKLCDVQCHILIKQYGPDHEDYFPSELNIMVGKKGLFRFEYTSFNMNNNNHVYQVKMMSEEAAIIEMFEKDFIIKDAADQLETPEVTAANSSKFAVGETVPFNIEETPNNGKAIEGSGGKGKGIEGFGGHSGNGGNGKRTIIDLDQYEEVEPEPSKKGKNELVQVKIEPKE
ncbi:replication protein A 70 kDa DNA-binding subunit B [Artemisia annua]|uniref:Replication protein A 70 kDa DNA-binding subunit B n=1 Tax=Artemisia annua TaxID=35608 RepID=A0A2U1N4E1_ARTAN|nr:replication protein A 70 kDa DNA-binding subunit B [Artemisia annua]